MKNRSKVINAIDKILWQIVRTAINLQRYRLSAEMSLWFGKS